MPKAAVYHPDGTFRMYAEGTDEDLNQLCRHMGGSWIPLGERHDLGNGLHHYNAEALAVGAEPDTDVDALPMHVGSQGHWLRPLPLPAQIDLATDDGATEEGSGNV